MQRTLFDLLLEDRQHGSSTKTSPESSIPKTTHLEHCWEDYAAVIPPSFHQQDGAVQVWLTDLQGPLPTEFLTPSSSAWPSDGSGSSCSLAAVLEDGPLPTRYFLSSKAAAGILRRAEARGKELPPQLAHALRAVAGLEPTSTLMED